MTLTVELRPHKGVKNTPLGPREFEHNQFLVLVASPLRPKPLHIGYIGKHESAPFNGLHEFRLLADDDKKEIASQLATLKGEDTVAVFEPPRS